MKSGILPLAGVGLGLALMVVSLFWETWSPAKKSWTPEKSDRLSELGSEANKLKFDLIQAKNNPSMQSGQNPAILQAEHDKIMAEYDELHAELVDARDGPAATSKTLRWTGIICAAIGVIFMLANRQDT